MVAPDAAHPPIDLDVRHGTFELGGQQAQLRRKARHTDARLSSDSRTKTFGESGDPGLRSTRAADGRPLTGNGRRPPARHRPRGPGVGTFDDGEHGLALGVEVRPQQGLKLLVHVLVGGVVHAVVMAAAARRSTPSVNAYVGARPHARQHQHHTDAQPCPAIAHPRPHQPHPGPPTRDSRPKPDPSTPSPPGSTPSAPPKNRTRPTNLGHASGPPVSANRLR